MSVYICRKPLNVQDREWTPMWTMNLVIIRCPWKFMYCNKCPTLVGEAVYVWGQEVYGKSLYFLLSFAENLKQLYKIKSIKTTTLSSLLLEEIMSPCEQGWGKKLNTPDRLWICHLLFNLFHLTRRQVRTKTRVRVQLPSGEEVLRLWTGITRMSKAVFGRL